MNVELELSLSRNMFGELTDDYKQRIRSYLERPSYEEWDDISGIILSDKGTMLTVWQAVCAVDPSFPCVGRRTTLEGKILKDWDRIPSVETLRQALIYATH